MARQKKYATKRLNLRPLTVKDFKAWCEAEARAFPPLNEWDRKPTPKRKLTYSFFKDRVQRHQLAAKEDRVYVWTIFLKETGEILGWIDIATLVRENYQIANFGYFIFNHQRGHGYVTEAARALVKAAFRDLKFHRLEAITDLHNKASIRTAKRIGFVREGVKKNYYFQNGRWEDQMVFMATPESFR